MTFDGFYLPGLDSAAIHEWRHLEQGGVRVRWPVLAPPDIEQLWQQLAAQRARVLLNTSTAEIVEAIAAAVLRMRRAADGTTGIISAFTGYSEPVVHETLQRMWHDWRAESLTLLLRSELGDLDALDHAVQDPHIPGKRIAAFGYPRVFHVFSGNVPGVAVTSLIRSLLVKSATLGKSASGEPILPVLLARALHDVAPALAECVAVSYWPRDSTALYAAAIHHADAVVAYGGAEAVAAVARFAGGKHVIVHGPRVSFGIVGEIERAALPRDVASAVAAYDQQGCVSPHVVYVVGSAERARRFAEQTAHELALITAELPRGRLTAEEAIAIRDARTTAEFAEGSELFGGEQDGFAVIYERTPTFSPSCLNRVLYVKPIPTTRAVLLQLPERRFLQSVALAGMTEMEKAELARALGLAGVSRITSFADLPWPPMHWHHDGSAPLRELLWWQDIES